MSRDTRSSYPLSSTHVMSPKRDRNAHTSSIFPYSTARPPTNYSAQSWLPQNPQPPPVPTSTDSRVPADENPFGGMEEEEEELEDPRETPLYARSDWEGDQETGPISGTGTAWSRSSFAGMTTAAPTAAFGGLEEIREVHDEEEELIVEDPAHAGRILSPERPISTGMRQRLTGHASEASLPSVIDLEDLKLSSAVANPFADPVVEPNRRRTSYLPEPTPNLQIERASPDFMSPAAHEKLGRMSVAPARYTLPPVQRDVSTNGSGDQASSLSLPVSFGSKAHQYFYTYRPFINTLLSFICVIFLTLAVQTSGTVSTIVIVQPGAFSVDAANGATVGLGAFGWCQRGVNNPTCRAYSDGDFANSNASLTIPGSSTLTTLGNVLIALTCFTWLLAVFLLVAAFLHFYFFFALSIPYSHVVKQEGSPGEKQGARVTTVTNSIQIEVDLRVRCERPPYEGYLWVWWAWWAHRRGPVGVIYAMLVGITAIITFGVSMEFERVVSSAVSGKGVSIGAGAYIPLLTLFLTLDVLVSATRYMLCSPAKSLDLFLNPPSPTPAAILLPLSEKPMEHIRPTSGHSFFAPPRATIMPDPLAAQDMLTSDPNGQLDPETRRWLAAYPSDPELVNLIGTLRQGKENDDFILSEVGLLYLRPEGDEPALLVPPAGKIREELISDAHIQDETEDEHIHRSYEEMMEQLGLVFWWMTMEEDIRVFIETCADCKGKERELRPGMTTVPFTGVTGWADELGEGRTAGVGPGESAMAAEMAFAMRQANEEAQRDALGI